MAESVTDEDLELTPGYKAPEKKSVEEMMNTDADDESLQRYKKMLLGDASKLKSDGPNVVVESLKVLVEGRDAVTLDLTKDLSKLKEQPVVLKEGCKYRLVVGFKVNSEMVSGLKMVTKISRKGIQVDKIESMVGSYAAKAEQQEYKAPEEEAPKGMISRGEYKCKSVFSDDDKNVVLAWDWILSIKKDWE